MYLEERLRFRGRIEAVGGSGNLGGGPGTVLARTATGADVFIEIWINNLNRGQVDACDYPTKLVNIVSVDVLHLQNRACAKLDVRFYILISNLNCILFMNFHCFNLILKRLCKDTGVGSILIYIIMYNLFDWPWIL